MQQKMAQGKQQMAQLMALEQQQMAQFLTQILANLSNVGNNGGNGSNRGSDSLAESSYIHSLGPFNIYAQTNTVAICRRTPRPLLPQCLDG